MLSLPQIQRRRGIPDIMGASPPAGMIRPALALSNQLSFLCLIRSDGVDNVCSTLHQTGLKQMTVVRWFRIRRQPVVLEVGNEYISHYDISSRARY